MHESGCNQELGKIVPVVVLDNGDRATELARAFLDGGLRSVEITMRTSAALGAIERIARDVPEIVVGAGTVLNLSMAQEAVHAGVRFIVSPGLDQNVVSWCKEHQVQVFPGVVTPTEIMAALELGINQVKFFPAEQSGGVRMLKALSAPFPGVRFMPTGGISLTNLREYLSLPHVIACGGSWLCPKTMIEAGDFAEIAVLCKEAIKLAESPDCP